MNRRNEYRIFLFTMADHHHQLKQNALSRGDLINAAVSQEIAWEFENELETMYESEFDIGQSYREELEKARLSGY